jgi:hypothetical protein
MIDSAARDQLSRNLRLLVAGRISSDQFEESIPETKQDPSITALADMAWLALQRHERASAGRASQHRAKRAPGSAALDFISR